MLKRPASAIALAVFLAIALAPPATAEALADLMVFEPPATDALAFDARDGVSTIGGLSVHGPIIEVCDATKSRCTAGYPGMAIVLPPDGKLSFSLTSHLPGTIPAMPQCMDQSDWSDTDGWRSLSGLLNMHTHGLLVKPYVKAGASRQPPDTATTFSTAPRERPALPRRWGDTWSDPA